MTALRKPPFDPTLLRSLVDGGTFARGEACFRDGLVELVEVGGSRAAARVSGGTVYRTEVMAAGPVYDGRCTCPAFARGGLCKHIVATALAANAAADGQAPGGPGRLERIRAHLAAQSVDRLADMVLSAAERDPALLRRLDLEAEAAAGDDATLGATLRAAIRDVVRTRGFVDYADVPEWVEGIDAVLDTLEQLASGPRAALVVDLAEQAAARIVKALGSIDDSAGFGGGLLHRAQRIHLAACAVARPEPVALAGRLFAREMDDTYGTLVQGAADYADVLGDAGLEEYRRLAQRSWDKIPAQVGPPRERAARPSWEGQRLLEILDVFAERDGDLDRRIALRAKDQSSPWQVLELASFCLQHGRADEALRHAEHGLWLFEDEDPDERLVVFTADLLVRAGRAGEAAARLWTAFAADPSMSLYDRLRAVEGEPAVASAVDLLRRDLRPGPSSLWDSPADLLIEILVREAMVDAAWDVARDHGASEDALEALARASEATHPRHALAVYTDLVDRHVRSGASGYPAAAALVARMAALRDPAEQSAYVADLKLRHNRKRNLMKMLG